MLENEDAQDRFGRQPRTPSIWVYVAYEVFVYQLYNLRIGIERFVDLLQLRKPIAFGKGREK